MDDDELDVGGSSEDDEENEFEDINEEDLMEMEGNINRLKIIIKIG